MASELPPGLVNSDFNDIHAAVMETARGRWFLAEYARRNRTTDTRMVLDAVNRLENLMRVAPSAALASPMATFGQFAATAGQIAERLQDITWDLREKGFSDDVCAAVDRQAAAVLGLARRLHGEPGAPEYPALQLQPAMLCGVPGTASINHCSRSSEALAQLDALPLAEKLAMFV